MQAQRRGFLLRLGFPAALHGFTGFAFEIGADFLNLAAVSEFGDNAARKLYFVKDVPPG